ncbi:MAG: two-component regulator propeller domain-containing protein [Paludibacter sp.]|nr:two-component regulator propeller domain-containing protein [Paludibacter sp.]
MKKILIATLFIFFGLTSTWSLPYKINYLTADNGLSRNLVKHIFRDSRGFIWISTSNGLDRYDGYNFIHYNSRNTKNALQSDDISCVEEDNNGNLLIGTESGLDFFNSQTGEIVSADKILETKLNLQSATINFIEKDELGDIWIGYDSVLAKLHYTDKNRIQTEIVYRSHSTITAFLRFNGNIYLGQDHEVFRIIEGSKGLYNKVSIGEKLSNFTGYINILYYDNGLIWIGTSFGLFKYDPISENISAYLANPLKRNLISSSYITDINKNKNGQLLIGTLIGLNIYDYRSDLFEHITTEINPSGVILNNNFVSNIFVLDNSIWVGTEKGGINIITPDLNIFNNVAHSSENPTSLSKNPVNSIYEDNTGNLWVGTVEGGLNLRKQGTTTFTHYYSQLGNTKSLSHNSVSSICQDYKGDYWFATWGKGINRLKFKDRYNPAYQQFYNNPASNKTLINDFVAAMASDEKNHALWIGTRVGLDFLDLDTDHFTHILNYLPAEKHLQFITGMFIDHNRRLWIGTGNGLFCIYLNKTNIKQNKIYYKHFHYELSNPSSRKIEKINCILETKEGNLWFGSNGNGIYCLDEKDGEMKFRNFNVSTGLLDNVIYGMLEDDAGRIWLSTDKGLCAYDPSKNSSRSYTTADGLKTNQFYWDSFFKGHDGKMYFGSVAGYTSFNPLKSTPVLVKNKASITRIKVLNEDLFPPNFKNSDFHLKFEGTTLNQIVLKESDKAFSVEFSALCYNMADKIKYAYRLKGFDNSWTEVSSDRRFANFTNIKYGDYDLEIKCTNTDGAWSDQVTTLKIKVIPPFYKIWWVIALFFCSLFFCAYKYSVHRINLLKKQKIQLKQLVEERTKEIELQKEMLEEQAHQLQLNMEVLIEHQDEMSRQNEKLVQQNQKITLQKEELILLSKKVQEVSIDKIAFFTNITHEFRTPITLILGPVERSLKLSTNPKVLEQLNIVQRNSRFLLTLINQLMDFRKVDSGKMELVKTQQNFVEFLDNLILPFEDLVKDRGIIFRKQYRINPSEFLFDKDNMQKVLGNLLSNAIKFTPDRGIITVIASTYIDKSDHKERLYVAIKDTGKGVPEEDMEKIFNRFYQSKQNQAYSGLGQSGTGIGLYLCKRIIQLHNGKIEVLNQNSGGSSFRFIIPIDRRLSTVVSVDGKPMEMLVANQDDEHEFMSEEILKGKPILLIVEDNNDMRQYIRSILSDEFNVIEAPNGVVGLKATNRYLPDLIISDIMMPEMDGMEFCNRVKTSFTTSHIPVILLTAKSSTDTQIESFKLGADAFLVKPFDEDLLKVIIRNLNEKRKRIQLNFVENMDPETLIFDDESLDKKFIDKTLKVIKENYTNPDFDVTEFMDAMGISRSLLHKKLKNLAGQSASRFIRIYRLNIARELIIKNRINHTLNISEIAYEVGFNDPKYFTRCFTKHFGIQPSSFFEDKKE